MKTWKFNDCIEVVKNPHYWDAADLKLGGITVGGFAAAWALFAGAAWLAVQLLRRLVPAAGAPTLGLFGPSDDRLYGPWGPHARALRGPRSFEQFKAADPNLNQTIRHMSDLPVTTVVKAARTLLAEARAGKAPEANGRRRLRGCWRSAARSSRSLTR